MQLLQDLMLERPLAPLHLLEHFVAIAVAQQPDWPQPLAVTPMPDCPHKDASSREHLPNSPVCTECASQVSLQPHVWRAMLSALLEPFPHDKLQKHVPTISAILDNSCASPSIAHLCSMLLQRIPLLCSNGVSQRSKLDGIHLHVQLFRLVLLALGSSQALYLLHHALLPSHAAAAALNTSEPESDKMQQYAWRLLIGVTATLLEHDTSQPAIRA